MALERRGSSRRSQVCLTSRSICFKSLIQPLDCFHKRDLILYSLIQIRRNELSAEASQQVGLSQGNISHNWASKSQFDRSRAQWVLIPNENIVTSWRVKTPDSGRKAFHYKYIAFLALQNASDLFFYKSETREDSYSKYCFVDLGIQLSQLPDYCLIKEDVIVKHLTRFSYFQRQNALRYLTETPVVELFWAYYHYQKRLQQLKE